MKQTQQQQPPRDPVAQRQQMAGSSEFQPGSQQQGSDKPQQQGGDKPQQMGEGSYEGAREYKERTERYLEQGTVERDAEAAKPRSEQEARELEQAEDEGLSRSRGES